MITPLEALIGLIVITAGIDLYLVFRPAIARGGGGKLLGFIGIFLLPLLICSMSVTTHMEDSKRTEFCLSCHMMKTHGMSLYVDDKEYIPAVHFQNHRIPKDQACFTCHTTYTMYGDYAAKLRGLKHLYYQYLGTIPDTIHLYEPFDNRECLHCHDGARSFEEQSIHLSSPGFMDSIKRGKMSCLASGCHDIAHDIKSLPSATFWKPADVRYRPDWMRDTNIMAAELTQIRIDHQFAKKLLPQPVSTPAYSTPAANTSTDSIR